MGPTPPFSDSLIGQLQLENAGFLTLPLLPLLLPRFLVGAMITPVGFNGFGDAASETASQAPRAASPSGVLTFARESNVSEKVAVALMAGLGVEQDELHSTLTMDLALTPEETITAVVANLMIGVGDEAKAATAIQQGQALRLFRSAKLMATQQGLGDVPAPVLPVVAAAPAAAPAQPTAVMKKTSEVLDQVDDSAFPVLPATKIAEYRDRYVEVMHGEPDDSHRPTSDQLSALAHRLARGSAPYVDLGLFGPFGDRISRIRKFSGQVWVDNELKTSQVSGPRTFEAWLGSWELFKAAMIMLDAAGVTALDKYSRGIKRLVDLHGNWPIIMLADERCRAERWEILAEKYARTPPTNYQPQKPWDAIIADAAYALHGPMSEWWYFSVVAPLTYKVNVPMAQVNMYEGTTGTIMETTTAASIGRPLGASAGGSGSAFGPNPKKQKVGGSGGPSKSSQSQSSEVCLKWNNGGCAQTCLTGRRHVCSICGEAHRKTECPKGKGAAAKGNGKGSPSGGDSSTNSKNNRRRPKANKGAGAPSKK